MLQSRTQKTMLALAIVMALGVFVFPQASMAQINTGLSAAAQQISGANTMVSKLVMAIGGIIGLVGGIRVYIKWNNGEREIQKEIVGWAGACLFLVLTGVVLQAFNIA
ncbi:MAG TPA: DUF4134 family protein [Chitinophagaceae bacterium]|nr:DUF4134 family protein [Chitinophagaceae bacterium]